MSRVLSGTAFAAAALAFTLPFGLVSSCDGGQVRFTGTELATFSVPADDAQDAELRDSLEHGAGPFAIAALVAAGFGLVLSILGRPGAGASAAIGLVAIQLLFYALFAVADGGDLFVGYWLALLSFVVAAAVCLIRDIRARRRSRKSVWPTIGLAVAVLLPPVGLIAVLVPWGLIAAIRTVRRGPRRALLGLAIPIGLAVLLALGVYAMSSRGASGLSGTARVDERLHPLGLEGESIERILADPKHPAVLYAVTGPALSSTYRTRDGGVSWEEIGLDAQLTAKTYGSLREFGLLAIDPTRPETLYGVIDSVLFKSVDGGDSWVALSPPRCHGTFSNVKCMGGFRAEVTALAVSPSDPTILYAATYGRSVFMSTDGGQSWAPAGRRLSDEYVWGVAVDAKRPATVYASTESQGTFRSTNAGRSWAGAESIGKAVVPEWQSIAVEPERPWTVYALGDELWRSQDDGVNWTSLDRRLFRSLGGDRGFVVTSMAIDPNRPQTLYAAVALHGNSEDSEAFLVKSTDAGTSWSVVARASGTNEGGLTFTLAALAVDPVRGRVYVGTDEGLFVCESCAAIPRPR